MKQMFDEEIKAEKKNLKTNLICKACGCNFVDDFFHKRCKDCRDEDRPVVKKLTGKKEFTGRTYPSGKSKIPEYPSVTSILHPEGIDFPEFLLKQYAKRGTIVHKLCEEYHKSNGLHWLDPHDIPELAEAVKIVEEGSLKLKWTDCDYIGFRKEHGHLIKVKELEQLVLNHKHKYGGRYDALGTYKGEKAILDFKTASAYTDDKLNDYFMQLSAYAKCIPGEDIKYLVIIPLNPKKGYEAPYVSSNIDKHFADFLEKREEFSKMYNL